MATLISRTLLPSARDVRVLVAKWVIALLVPLLVFTFVWNGEATINQILVGFFMPNGAIGSLYDTPTRIWATIFFVLFYAVLIALVGYAVAADSGRQNPIRLWISMLLFTVVPIVLISLYNDLFVGLSFSVLVWLVGFLLLRLWQVTVRLRRRSRSAATPPPLTGAGNLDSEQQANVTSGATRSAAAAPPFVAVGILNSEQQANLVSRAIAGGFWFGTAFAATSLVVDLIYFFAGQYGASSGFILIWIVLRTVLLPIAGYFLGRLGGVLALRYTLKANGKNGDRQDAHNIEKAGDPRFNARALSKLSASRAQEETRDLVPNDLPLQSRGARNFYLLLLFAFLLFYPMLDPFLFGNGTSARLAQYGDAGRYVILALGLNIVVGFAGLLDLGYVAFFVFGAYTWGLIGSPQLTALTGIVIAPNVLPWLFWPMLLVAALIAAFWGVLLGAPTLRLRGDYLAIVTLGFGEIIPIIAQNMDQYTKGTNGLTGISSPAFFGATWNVATPEPYYYLMLFLVALVLFANVRLRDSRLGRAWIAIREDEIAAASSGINLVKTKLFAFGAGAFFSGIAGAYYSAKLSTITSSNFSFNDSVLFLSMVVLGGLGSIPGVVVGALAVYAITQLVLPQLDGIGGDPTSLFHPFYEQLRTVFPNFTFGNIRNVIFGIVLISIMIFRPEGLIPSARRRRELHKVEEEEVEVGSLDVVPGAPGFEEEVRIE